MNRRQFVYRSSLLSLAAAGLPLISRAIRQSSAEKPTDLYMGDKREEGSRSFAYAVRLPQAKTPTDLKGVTSMELAVIDYASGAEKPQQTFFTLSKKGSADINETYISFQIGKPTLLRGNAKLPQEFLSKCRLDIMPHDNIMFGVDKDTVMLNYRESDKQESDDSSDCFLTSACVYAKGLPDDCRELTALRHYRDTYLRPSAGGAALVEEYYSVGPRVVAAINARSNSRAIYAELYDSLVTPSLAFIQAGALAEARGHYHAYTQTLREIFLKD